MECPKHNAYSTHRAEVRACPKCGRILDAEELYRMLESLGISQDTIEKVKEEIILKIFLS